MMNDIYVVLLASILAYMLTMRMDMTSMMQKEVSLLGAAYGLWLYGQIQDVGYTVLLLIFSMVLLWGATIDKHFYILPDEGAWLLVIGGLVHIYIRHQSLGLALLTSGGLALVSLTISYISRQGLGMGDVKWMSALALWLTPQGVYEMVSLSCILGSLYLLLHMLKEKAVGKSYVPFGPYLALGACLAYIDTYFIG